MRIRGVWDTYDVEDGDPIASGGNADLFRCKHGDLVYKRYKKVVRSRRAVSQLFDVMKTGRQLLVIDQNEPGSTPESSINWPVDLVAGGAGDDVQGVIIPMIPARFFHDGEPRDFSYLSLARSQPPPAGVRVPVLVRFAEIMAWLDQHELVHGDISYKNMVWSANPVGVYLIDSDGLQRRGHPTQAAATPQWVDPRRSLGLVDRHDHYSDRYALGLAMYRGLLLNPGYLDRRPDGSWPQPESLPPTLDPAIRELIRDTLSDPVQTDRRPRPRSWVEALVRVYVRQGRFDEGRLKVLDDYAERYREAERRKAQAGRANNGRRVTTPAAPSQVWCPPHAQPTATVPPAPYVRRPTPPPPPTRRSWRTYLPSEWSWQARAAAFVLFLLVSSMIADASSDSGRQPSSPGSPNPGSVGGASTGGGSTEGYVPTSGSVSTDDGERPGGRTRHKAEANRWIAQLGSIDAWRDQSYVSRRLEHLRRRIPQAEVLLSRNFDSLRSGYWVLYHPGPFRNGIGALHLCSSRGWSDCIGRYLSHHESDYGLQCKRDREGPDGCFN